MLSDSSTHHGLAVILCIGLCTLIGLGGAMMEAGEIGPLKTWFWIGLGLAGIYLLTVIANGLDQLGTNH